MRDMQIRLMIAPLCVSLEARLDFVGPDFVSLGHLMQLARLIWLTAR